MDINGVATLGIRIEMPGAEQVAPGLDRITAAGARTEQAFRQTMASAQDFARAGANAAQVAQLTGASIADARQAVQLYGESMAMTVAETEGLRAAQVEMLAAGMQLTDSTRAMTIAQMQAIEMDVARTAALNAQTAAFDLSGVGLGRIRQGLVSLVAQSTGTIPVIDRMGAALLGGFGVQGFVMIAVLAGLAALAFAWDKITESSREARKEQEAAMKVADDYAKKKALGAGGQLAVGVAGDAAKAAADLAVIQRLQDQRDALMRSAASGHPGEFFGQNLAQIDTQIAALKSEYAKLASTVAVGGAEVTRLTSEAFDREQATFASNLAVTLRANEDDRAVRSAAIEQLKIDQALLAQYMALPITATNLEAVNAYAHMVKDLGESLMFVTPAEQSALDRLNALGEAIHKAYGPSNTDLVVAGNGMLQESYFDWTEALAHANREVERNIALTGKQTAQTVEAIKADQRITDGIFRKSEEDAKRQEEAAERLFLQPFESAIRGVEQANSNFFENLFKPHTNAVQEFWMDFKNIAIKTFADILSLNFMEQLLGADSKAGLARSFASMLGVGGGSGETGETTTGGLSNGNILMSVLGPLLASGGLGYGAGYSTSNSAVGLLAGAGAGALSGSALGPFGAIAGGVVGLIGGIFGSQKRHSDDAADALAKLAKETNKVAQSLSNLPDGFKIAYDEFLATTGRGGYAYGGGGPSGGGGGGIGVQVQGPGGGSITINNLVINGANVKDLPSLVKAVQSGARASLNRGGAGLTLAMAP